MTSTEERASTTTSKLDILLYTTCAMYVLYYVLALDRRPRLVCRLGRMQRFMNSGVGTFLNAFYRTPIWCVGANFQSVVSFLFQVVDEVRRRYPNRALLAVGYSLGGLLISLYLIKFGGEARIDAALAISTPFHLATAKRNLEQWWNSNFGLLIYMASNLVEHLKDNEDVLRFCEEVNADAVLSSWTLHQFDKTYTAPVFGFKSTEELYESCSLKGKLSRVRRPLLFLLAGDDVFGSPETFPEDEILASPWLAAVVTPSGGHLGFVEGWLFPRLPFYAERFAAAYVQELLRVVGSGGPRGLARLGEDI